MWWANAAGLGLDAIDTATTSATGDDVVFLSSATNLSTLRDGRGIRFGAGNDLRLSFRDGTSLEVDLNTSVDGNPVTVGQLVDRLNAAASSKYQAKLSSDGNAIEIEDLTTGSSSFSIADVNGSVGEDLGLEQTSGTATITGKRVQSGLSGPLLSGLLGGKGTGTLGEIRITNRNNVTTNIDLASSVTVRDIIDTINNANAGGGGLDQ